MSRKSDISRITVLLSNSPLIISCWCMFPFPSNLVTWSSLKFQLLSCVKWAWINCNDHAVSYHKYPFSSIGLFELYIINVQYYITVYVFNLCLTCYLYKTLVILGGITSICMSTINRQLHEKKNVTDCDRVINAPSHVV